MMCNKCKDCVLFHIEHKFNMKTKTHYVEYYCGVGKSPVYPEKLACKYYNKTVK